MSKSAPEILEELYPGRKFSFTPQEVLAAMESYASQPEGREDVKDAEVYYCDGWEEGCKKLLQDIQFCFSNPDNIKKADTIRDKEVFKAIGETIINFPIPIPMCKPPSKEQPAGVEKAAEKLWSEEIKSGKWGYEGDGHPLSPYERKLESIVDEIRGKDTTLEALAVLSKTIRFISGSAWQAGQGMRWVKASERLPEVMLGESKQFVCRDIESKRHYFFWYGRANGCKLNRFPNRYEWLESSGGGMAEALEKIANWELPATGKFWDEEKTRPTSYETEYGSNGVRDYIRSIAKLALSGGSDGVEKKD